MSLTFAFVMDPLDRVIPEVDTSFAFMLAAQQRGHRVLHVQPREVGLDHEACILRGRYVKVADQRHHAFTIEEELEVPATDCDAIVIRTDPPFDQDYLTVTWMLSFAERQGVRCINSPRGLRQANEKLYALEFPELCPRTLVSSSRARIQQFVTDLGGEAVIKPVDGHGGFGVLRLHAGDSNLSGIVDMLTLEGRQATMVQAYIPEAVEGDRRLFVLDGELRAAVLRVPAAGEHRSNVHVGGRVEACEVGDRDREIVAAMRDRLRADGLYFVGLDVIGNELSEVNVTSPTLICELHRLGGPDLATEVIVSVEEGAKG